MKNLLKKLSSDQFIIAPITTCLFFTMNEGFQGNGIQGIKDRVEADYKKVLFSNWCVWIPAQFINFYFITVSGLKYPMNNFMRNISWFSLVSLNLTSLDMGGGQTSPRFSE